MIAAFLQIRFYKNAFLLLSNISQNPYAYCTLDATSD